MEHYKLLEPELKPNGGLTDKPTDIKISVGL